MRFSLRTLLLILALAPILIAAVYWRTPRPLSTADQKAVLDAVLKDVLSNPGLKFSRDFYGTPGDTDVGLVWSDHSRVNWPDDYRPDVSGYKFWPVTGRTGGRAPNQPRLLGVSLTRFDGQEPKWPSGIEVGVVIVSAGGSRNGVGTIGGCQVFYTARRHGRKWVATYESSIDP